jgi:hypothetical protein
MDARTFNWLSGEVRDHVYQGLGVRCGFKLRHSQTQVGLVMGILHGCHISENDSSACGVVDTAMWRSSGVGAIKPLRPTITAVNVRREDVRCVSRSSHGLVSATLKHVFRRWCNLQHCSVVATVRVTEEAAKYQ